MYVIPLASGSKGNSYLVHAKKTTILIDAGISAKQLCIRLENIGTKPETISALFITHEHTDHISGARVFAKKYHLPVFMNTPCFESANEKYKLEEIPDIRLFDTGYLIEYQDFIIHPVSVSHDTSDPVCFSISDGKKSLGIVTDLGKVSTLIRRQAMQMDALILESNHDIRMLKMNTSYPEKVKQRIRSNRGHLSNCQAAEFARDIILNGKLRHLMLAHLSEKNNSETASKNTFSRIFRGSGIDLPFSFAKQDITGPKITL